MDKPQRENSGVLFKNDKNAKPAHADYTVQINVEGKEFWLNAWVKESAKGTKYFSVSVRSKEMLRGQHGPEKKPTPRKDDYPPARSAEFRHGEDDDGIPF